jgi:hypothetical protein
MGVLVKEQQWSVLVEQQWAQNASRQPWACWGSRGARMGQPRGRVGKNGHSWSVLVRGATVERR